MHLFFLEGVLAPNHNGVNCNHRRTVGIGADSRVRYQSLLHIRCAQQFLSYIWGSRCYLLCTLDEKEELQQSTGDMIGWMMNSELPLATAYDIIITTCYVDERCRQIPLQLMLRTFSKVTIQLIHESRLSRRLYVNNTLAKKHTKMISIV